MTANEILEKFGEGLNETLFLEFRGPCEYHIERRVPEMETQHECSHEGNSFRTDIKRFGLPNCFLEACPLFIPLKHQPGYQQLFDQFCDRLERIPK